MDENQCPQDIASVRLKVGLARGVAFLLARQDADGLWRDIETLAGIATDWPTGFVATHLLEAGVRGAPIDAAALALIERQQRDGGWGFHRGVPSDADTTAWVMMLLTRAKVGRNASERAGRFLVRHQDATSGGVSTFGDPEPIRRYMGLKPHADLRGWCANHLEVTATVGRALAGVPGGRFHTEAANAWRYVERRQATDGGWASFWWVGRHYPTLQAATLAAILCNHWSTERAAEWALAGQLPGGAWGEPLTQRSAFATALSLAVLLRRLGHHTDKLQESTGFHSDALARGLEELLSFQAEDGGWPPHASLRIPLPHVAEPDDIQSWRVGSLGTGVIVRDHRRLFTTAASVATLALASTLGALE